MDNLFKPQFSLFTNTDNGDSRISFMYALLSVLPFGSLFARIFLLDGSLDKIWLLFPMFLFPPFSIISAVLMKFGYIKKGKGGTPYDMFMLIPIISKFLLDYAIIDFFELFYEDVSSLDTFLSSFIIQLVIGMIPYIIRAKKLCKQVTFTSFCKAFIDSTIANSVGELFPFMVSITPFIGGVFRIIEWIPYLNTQVDNVLWSCGYFIGYVVVNMFNADDMYNYCNPKYYGKNKLDIVGFFIMLSVTMILKIKDAVSPSNLAEMAVEGAYDTIKDKYEDYGDDGDDDDDD